MSDVVGSLLVERWVPFESQDCQRKSATLLQLLGCPRHVFVIQAICANMRALRTGKLLLLAVATTLVVLSTHCSTLHSKLPYNDVGFHRPPCQEKPLYLLLWDSRQLTHLYFAIALIIRQTT